MNKALLLVIVGLTMFTGIFYKNSKEKQQRINKYLHIMSLMAKDNMELEKELNRCRKKK